MRLNKQIIRIYLVFQMISSNQSNVQIWNFRSQAIHKILSLEPKSTKISRKEQFLAITLLDEFLLANLDQQSTTSCPSNSMILPYCIVCITLACKFQTQCSHKFATLASLFDSSSDLANVVQLCMIAESEILLALDFTIPGQTFYSCFQALEQNVNLSRRQASYFLKLFVVGVEYSTQLTQNPKYGGRIFQNILLCSRQDREIAQYIQKIKDWNKNRVNEKTKN